MSELIPSRSLLDVTCRRSIYSNPFQMKYQAGDIKNPFGPDRDVGLTQGHKTLKAKQIPLWLGWRS